MTLSEFKKGMFEHFCISDYKPFIDEFIFQTTKQYALDILEFDNYLHKKYGAYENRGITMNHFIREKYGLDAQKWAEESVGLIMEL